MAVTLQHLLRRVGTEIHQTPNPREGPRGSDPPPPCGDPRDVVTARPPHPPQTLCASRPKQRQRENKIRKSNSANLDWPAVNSHMLSIQRAVIVLWKQISCQSSSNRDVRKTFLCVKIFTRIINYFSSLARCRGVECPDNGSSLIGAWMMGWIGLVYFCVICFPLVTHLPTPPIFYHCSSCTQAHHILYRCIVKCHWNVNILNFLWV